MLSITHQRCVIRMPKAFLYKMSECLSFALGIPNAYYLKPKALSEAQLTKAIH